MDGVLWMCGAFPAFGVMASLMMGAAPRRPGDPGPVEILLTVALPSTLAMVGMLWALTRSLR